MSAQEIRVAVREKDGKSHIFTVQHQEIQTHEQAIALAKNEFPDARVVLATVPNLAASSEEIAA